MVTFPNCKINFGLNILRKREDGFHDLETVFYPLPFHDILEIVTSNSSTELINTGISGGNEKDNLCLKAYQLLQKDFPDLPTIKIHLHKTIPVGAGLGGGSSDAAFMLKLLNEKFDLNLSQEHLLGYTSQLGSDCPFFLVNEPVIAQGVGEKMERIPLSLSSYKLLLINPGIHISTKKLFQKITPSLPEKSISQIISQPIETWKNELKNDFEPIVFRMHPEVEKIKKLLYEYNAGYASMTGSGSSVFGIFPSEENLEIELNKDYFHKWLPLS
ncbi:MAG: 4-(cytidine 5'-diphospho)-2-C-methyl-D-erythritol kinase [Ginsengibacter sp.]